MPQISLQRNISIDPILNFIKDNFADKTVNVRLVDFIIMVTHQTCLEIPEFNYYIINE